MVVEAIAPSNSNCCFLRIMGLTCPARPQSTMQDTQLIPTPRAWALAELFINTGKRRVGQGGPW